MEGGRDGMVGKGPTLVTYGQIFCFYRTFPPPSLLSVSCVVLPKKLFFMGFFGQH